MATSIGHPSSLYRVRIGVTVAAAGILLAACGSSSKTSSAGTSTTTSTAPSTSASAQASKSSGSSKTNLNLGGGSFCDKAKTASANVGAAAESITTDTPDKLKTFEQNALTELKALETQAPSEIKGPITTLVNTESGLVDALQTANYDFTKLNPDFATKFDTPQFTQAVTQIDNYLETKCGINPSAEATP
jgi:outer membrane PBP1 activator LpoA protein